MRSGRSDRNKNTSKFISLILRHKPETIGITLDEHGWADVWELIDGINQSEGHTLDMEILEEIVRTDEKQRYSFTGCPFETVDVPTGIGSDEGSKGRPGRLPDGYCG